MRCSAYSYYYLYNVVKDLTLANIKSLVTKKFQYIVSFHLSLPRDLDIICHFYQLSRNHLVILPHGFFSIIFVQASQNPTTRPEGRQQISDEPTIAEKAGPDAA
jgi:hypothetical protein